MFDVLINSIVDVAFLNAASIAAACGITLAVILLSKR